MQLPIPLRDTRPLEAALAAAGTDHFCGILRVIGEPGGDIRFADGRIVAVTTGGAPGFDALDRVAGERPLGAARARLLRMTATVDGAFAIAAGWVERCHRIDTGPDDIDAGESGYEAPWLVDETDRRITALAHAGFSPYRNLLARTAAVEGGEGPGAGILRLADGTRTCRDLAFRLGRPLYPVSVEVARLLATGLLTVHHADDRPGPADTALPRRRRGASGINDTLRPRPPQPVPPSTTVDEYYSPLRRRSEKIT